MQQTFIKELVRASRKAQGLGPTVADEAALRRLAALVARERVVRQ